MDYIPVSISTINGAVQPRYANDSAVGFDLAVNEDVTILKGRVLMAKTGIILRPHPGYWIMVVARGSLQKYGLMLANNVGIVNPDYCGATDQIHIPLFNFSDHDIKLIRGERVAQGIIMEQLSAVFSPFTPATPDRGGFGSTGR